MQLLVWGLCLSRGYRHHDSRTDRRWCRTRADLGALQAVSRQDRELIVTPVCLSAPMASPAFTLCNCCESRSCQLAMERPGRPEGRPATWYLARMSRRGVSSGRSTCQGPDGLTGGDEGRQRLGPGAEADDQLTCVADHTSRQTDQMEAQGFHPLRHPALSQYQPLHRGVQVQCQDHQRPPGRVGAEQSRWQLSAGEIGLHHRVHFLALAAPLTQPPDDLIGRVLPVGHDTEQFVNALLTKRLRREWQVRLIAQCQLTQWFTDRQKPVIRPLPAVPGPGWHIADLGILLTRLLGLAVHRADQRLPFALRGGQHRRAERLSHVGADREVDDAEAWVFAFATIQQQLFLVARRIRT